MNDFLADRFRRVAEQEHAGNKAGARKRGRNPKWPYVPVILTPVENQNVGAMREAQVLAKAFATREEAVAYAQKCIEWQIANLAERLGSPECEAEREFRGFPRNLADCHGDY